MDEIITSIVIVAFFLLVMGIVRFKEWREQK